MPEGTEFAVEYSLDGGETWGAATVPLGQVVTSPDLPAGTEVLFREGELRDVDGVEWGEPVVDPASVTVGSGATVEVTMTNTAAPEPGSFTVAKLVDGEAAAQVPPGAGFTIEYSVDGGGTWEPVTVPAGGTTVSSGDLPAGTQVMVRETGDRPDVPGVTWGDVTLEVDGGPVDGDTATFTVGSGEVVAVVATNTAEYLPGTFSVAKVVEGDAADAVPPGTGFTVEYTVDGEAATATVVVGEPWPSPELEHGAEVTVTEVGLPEVDGVVWGEPVLAVDGVPVEGEATFTVEAGTEIGVVLTNTAAPEAGRFQVSKAVDGEAADDVPGGTRFLLEYSTDGGATWLPLVVTADGTPVASPDVPAGTEIVVRETVARDEVPGVGWTGVRFVVDGTPVPGGLDQATFTVEAGGVVEIVVVNTAGPTPPEPTPSPTPSPPEPTPTPTEPTPGPSELTPSPSATAPGPPGPDGPGPDTPGPPGTPLPITGATGTLLLIVAAAAAVLVGGTLIAVRRRRDT
ncbi:DUF5979 domain-containing protein [Myceligenerans salitolerans]|uniref:DUF5979 domain-containing protein n=1 Tax=Myceligenerans salitolerans TaxID=1230528 RepID=UPI0027DC74C8|nr:DUF5979 domain-containing protein [Myceligenerans salitolerans]